MKNTLFTLFSLCLSTILFGQIKVISSGDVGIGTLTPGFQFEVESSDEAIAQFTGTNAGQARINIKRESTGTFLNMGIAKTAPVDDWGYFWTSGGTFMIGTDSSPRPTLQVHGMHNGLVAIAVPIGSIDATSKLHIEGKAVKPGGGDWETPSDKRLKKNISSYNGGLEEILSLNPVKFSYNGKAGIEDKSEHIGLIAQEYQKVAPYAVSDYVYAPNKEYDNSGVLKSLGSGVERYLSIDASPIRYMLVNAIKEQQSMIDEKQELIDELETRISKLEQLVSESLNANEEINVINVELTKYDVASLEQNIPNPFIGSTSIHYVIPTDSQKASIKIYDIEGREIRTVNILNKGKGVINIEANNLPASTYTYQLIVDGRIIDSKRMLLNK